VSVRPLSDGRTIKAHRDRIRKFFGFRECEGIEPPTRDRARRIIGSAPRQAEQVAVVPGLPQGTW